MIQQFVAKRSVSLVAINVLMHVFVACVILNFQMLLQWKLLLTLAIAYSLLINLSKLWRDNIILHFETATNGWRVFEENNSCMQFDSALKIYMNRWFVWVVFYTNDRRYSKGIIIGSDSLPAERFIQLRRCILCPEVLK